MRVTDWCCSRQLQASINILQCKCDSEALARDQVHENKGCQSQMTMTTCETKKNLLLIRMIETCVAVGSNLATFRLLQITYVHLPLQGLASCRMTVAGCPTTAITPPKGQSAPHQRPRLKWRECLRNKKKELEIIMSECASKRLMRNQMEWVPYKCLHDTWLLLMSCIAECTGSWCSMGEISALLIWLTDPFV